MIDTLWYALGRSLPGATGLLESGIGGTFSDATQARLRSKIADLTKGDTSLPIVVVGWNSERFDGYNLALRLVALGYTKVYWYRGGREAWEVAGLPETEFDMQRLVVCAPAAGAGGSGSPSLADGYRAGAGATTRFDSEFMEPLNPGVAWAPARVEATDLLFGRVGAAPRHGLFPPNANQGANS